MLSVVVLKINNEKNSFESLNEADWNDDKQLKLENYVKSIANETDNVNDFFERVEWPYLITYLNIESQQLIQMKVDEIYEEQYATKVNENGVNTIIEDFKNKDNSIYKEVCQLVENLDLQAFKVNEKDGLKEGSDDIQPPENDNPNQTDGQLLGDNIDEGSSLPDGISNENGKAAISPKMDLPKLTTTQRRTSLDLMYTVPRFYTDSTEISDQIHSTKKRPNLSKPASATTTNINVTTKTDIKTNSNQKQVTVSNSNRFQNFLRKMKLKITRNVSEVAPSPKSPLIIQLDDTLKGTHENIVDDSKNLHGKQGKDKSHYNVSALRKGRRLSLVGENLPLYIRQQLEANHSNQNPVLENSQVDSASSRSLSRRQSRMHNLLENSQSLYSQSKDLSLMGSETNQDDYTMPNTSEIERLNENNEETENGSDDDKEYILPDLLARYYGSDANEEDLMTNIDAIGDAFDFINVRSYDAFENMEGEEAEEEEAEEEGYNEDDEYLFKI